MPENRAHRSQYQIEPRCRVGDPYRIFEKFAAAFNDAAPVGKTQHCVTNSFATACVWEKMDNWSMSEYLNPTNNEWAISYSKRLTLDGKSYKIVFSKMAPMSGNGAPKYFVELLNGDGRSLVKPKVDTCKNLIDGGSINDDEPSKLESLRMVKSAIKMITGDDVRINANIPLLWVFEQTKEIGDIAK